MANVKLKCLAVNKYGQNVVLPIVGEITIPADGSAFEVDELVAKTLISGGNKNYRIEAETDEKAGKAKSKDKNEDTGAKTGEPAAATGSASTDEEDEGDEDDSEEEEEDGDNPLDKLDELELPELIDLAKTLELPEAEYAKFSKKKNLMVAFLKKQK